MPRAKRISDFHPELGLPEVRKLWQTERLFSDHYLKKRIRRKFLVADGRRSTTGLGIL